MRPAADKKAIEMQRLHMMQLQHFHKQMQLQQNQPQQGQQQQQQQQQQQAGFFYDGAADDYDGETSDD
jgi:hypothetical protein